MLLFACMLVVGALSGCGNSESDTAAANKLVVYSPNSEEIIKTIIPCSRRKQGLRLSW